MEVGVEVPVKEISVAVLSLNPRNEFAFVQDCTASDKTS